ncbi:hypothetical protein NAT51_14775 [Flavobacterium amniphilum]|uniref:hypothetical protein n=1 Tax=Flavobacterium amniphilum TaxID=1834035 RepID=UPI00202AAB7D|nr:hypothetical protein [Flavobacterium amniphilum]MCL9806796.1 hypothetical protein [Flavobacterium amniphilum]
MGENHLNISEDIDAISREILDKYWLNENGEFIHKVNNLSKEYNLTSFKITELAKNHSSYFKSKICERCRIEYFEKIETRGKLKGDFWNVLCENCEQIQKEEQKKINDEKQNQINNRLSIFNKSFYEKNWEKLNQNEFEIYEKIIANKTLKNIKQNIFKNDFYCQSTWSVFNKLEQLNLIIIERDSYKTVLNIYFDERVENIISRNNRIENIIPRNSTIEIKDTLSFSLSKKLNKTKQNQPDYSGTFILKNDVVLKAGVKYLYGGWSQTDDSINLKFTPLGSIPYKPIQSEIENEPKLVEDILKDFFNVLVDNEINQNPFGSLNDDLEDSDVPF